MNKFGELGLILKHNARVTCMMWNDYTLHACLPDEYQPDADIVHPKALRAFVYTYMIR